MSQSPPGPPPESRGSARAAILILVAAAVLGRWLFLAATGATYEDAFISLRYAENLARGHGMVYNAGERVFGASTPLYVLFLAGLVRVGLPALLIAKTAAALADGVTLYLWARRLRGETQSLAPSVWFALLFGLSPLIVPVSVSGMETSFALLLLTLALLADARDRPAGLGASLGVLALVRPDGLLAALVLLALRWRRTGRIPWVPALLSAGILLPWIAWATFYYGSPLPHSIPAKAAAYNLHRPSILPNLGETLAQVAPSPGHWGRVLVHALLLPCFLLGLREAFRRPRWRPVAVLIPVWWAYLVLPRTLLFIWYFPLLLLPVYVVSALGFSELRKYLAAWLRLPAGRTNAMSLAAMGVAAVGLVPWLVWTGERSQRQQQQGELQVRRAIGLWLRENTPPDARIALEPIGYIGYYSQRRILDEVGLVSPEMVPLNRAGAGWFPEMLERHRPDYVVERPYFLLRNLTINSRIPMFRREAEREAFLLEYEPVAAFSEAGVPDHLRKDFYFTVYARRSAESRRDWQRRWAGLSAAERSDLLRKALYGSLPPTPRAASGPAPRRPR